MLRAPLCVASEKNRLLLPTLGTLAAGYKLRVLIAQCLFGKPDVLLLDEPTNHLDLDAIERLESFLSEYTGALLLVRI